MILNAAGIGIGLGLVWPLTLIVTRHIIFGQPKSPVIPESATHRINPITLVVDRSTLHGWLAMPQQKPKQALLFFNGRKENPTTLFTLLAEVPEHAVMVFHRRGLGPSGGLPSERAHVRDGLQAVDWLCEQLAIEPDALTIIGRSLGSGVAVQVAGRRKVCSLVLISAFDRLEHIIKHHYPWLPRFLLRDKFVSVEHMAAVRCPCLSVVGDQDTVIPAEFSRALLRDWTGGTLVEFVAPEGEHRGLLRNSLVLTVLAKFVRQAHEKNRRDCSRRLIQRASVY